MGRIRTAFVSGVTTNNPLASGGTTLNSASLANLPVIASPDIAVIVLDPAGSAGNPEVVYVTAHSSAATSATIARAKEGTSAREHAVGTAWVHAPTLLDFEAAQQEFLIPLITPGWAVTTGALVSSNDAVFSPIVPLTANVTLASITIHVETPSGNIDIGIYEWDGTTMSRIVSTGATDASGFSSNSTKTLDITNIPLYRGTRYFFAVAADNTTLSLGRFSGVTADTPSQSIESIVAFYKGSSYPLPATVTSLSGWGEPYNFRGNLV